MRIRFCSPIRSHMGYAELGRILINQLVVGGFEVSVLEIPVQGSDADFGPLCAQAIRLMDATAAGKNFDVNIVNMIPNKFEDYRLAGARNIGYSMFETDRLPAAWVPLCNAMDAMWVPSEWMRGVFIDSGVTVPVFIVGVDATPTPLIEPRPGPFRLLSMFQWSARKNPVNLLRAYCAAFDGNTDVVLTLKVHRSADADHNKAFVQNAINSTLSRAKASRSLPRIEIATEMFSSRQIRQLHADSHAYVSLSHAEGWGLPAWEATLAGKPVVHTGWSSPVEFVHPQGLVRHNLSPVFGMEEFVPFYDIGMRWAEPHLDDAVDRLRDLHANYDRWTVNSIAQRKQVNEQYAMERRVAQLKTALA